MRSLELQRPMVRATNTGATAVIDHRGRGRDVAAAVPARHARRQRRGRSGLTPFATWAGTLGLWPLFAIGVATLLAPASAAAQPP
jgi:apolipoprotein N-acyltransferase